MAEKNKEVQRRSYNFIVYFGKKQVGFEKLSGLTEEGDFEIIREGGCNRKAYALLNGYSREKVLTLERGVLEGEKELSLYRPGYRFQDEVAIMVLGHNRTVKKSYFLNGAYIRRISQRELSAGNSGIQTVSIELGYDSLEEEGNNNEGAWRSL